MPTYLFTFHGYGTWLPDREEGYVRPEQGLLPQDFIQAKAYRSRMHADEVLFDQTAQRVMIEELLIASQHQSLRLHYVATELTHIHVLVTWSDERPWEKVRSSVKSSLSRRLKLHLRKRNCLSEGGSRRLVSSDEHFDYLVQTYLPGHSGLKWSELFGFHENGTVVSGGC